MTFDTDSADIRDDLVEHYRLVRSRIILASQTEMRPKPVCGNTDKLPGAPSHPSAAPVVRDIIRIATARDGAMDIVKQIAEQHGVSVGEIMSPRRKRNIVIARHACYVAIRKAFPAWSYPMMGRFFKRDHSTLVHAMKKYGAW